MLCLNDKRAVVLAETAATPGTTPPHSLNLDLRSAPDLDSVCAQVPAPVMLAEGWAPIWSDGRAAIIATSAQPTLELEQRIRTRLSEHQLWFVILDRVALQEFIIRHNKREIADHMANGFARSMPERSAKTGFATWQTLLGAAILLATLGSLLLAPSSLLLVLAAICCATALLTATLAATSLLPASRFASSAERATTVGAPQIADEELPFYTIVLPVYQEAAVVGELLRSMSKLTYPRDRLEVLLMIEERDIATKETALASGHMARYIRIVDLPPGPPQTKPRSCNLGLMLAREGLLVIFDAEDRPESDQLLKSAAAFAAAKGDDLACVQAKLFFYNAKQNLLTAQFALEYALRFDLMLPGLARLGLPIPLGGTSNHFRTDLLRAAGGWDAWNVTEDADLGMRCRALGYRVDVMDSITWEEATTTPSAWVRQRTRWLKGAMVTFLVHTRRPLETLRRFRLSGMIPLLGIVGGIPATFFGQSLSTPLWLLELAGVPWLSIESGWRATATMYLNLIGMVLMVGATLVVSIRRKMGLSHMAALLPGYWSLFWVAVWRALFQLVRSPFSWEKTPHGQAVVPTTRPASSLVQHAATPASGRAS